MSILDRYAGTSGMTEPSDDWAAGRFDDEPAQPPSLAEQAGILPCEADEKAVPCPSCGWLYWWDDPYGGRHCCRCSTPPARAMVAGVVAAIKAMTYDGAGQSGELVPGTPGWQDVTEWVIRSGSGGRWRHVFPGLAARTHC